MVLPATFKGGAPTSSALKAQVRTLSNGKTWLANMQKYFAEADIEWLLGMIGKSSKTRWVPMVLVSRAEIPSYFSLSDFTGEMVPAAVDGITVTMLGKTDTRESYIIGEPKTKTDPAYTRLHVFVRSGDYVYMVEYSGTKVAFSQFENAFKQSAARIRIAEGTTATSTTTTTAGTTSTTASTF